MVGLQKPELRVEYIDKLAPFINLIKAKKTSHFGKILTLKQKTVFILSGNQGGKTHTLAMDAVLSILGIHPLKDHNRCSKNIRCLSSSLPESVDPEAQDNTQYLELKKLLPYESILKDITARSQTMTVSGHQGKHYIEFKSTKQEVQDTGKVQRDRLWCIAEGQRVLMANGIWRNIEFLKPGEEIICEAFGGHGETQRTNRIKAVIKNGEKEVYRFNCQKGINFEVTADHPVMIPKAGRSAYTLAGSLKIGDKVKCKFSDIKGQVQIDRWKLVLLAMVLGDGTLTYPSQVKFTNKNEELVKQVKNYLPQYIHLTKKEIKDHAPDWFITDKSQRNNEFLDFIRQVGLHGTRAHTKFVPDCVFTETEHNIAIFLRFLFACDGWANGHRIGYCSTSHRLAQDVFLLLRRLGIQSTISIREFQNNWNTQWWVNITQARDVIRFCSIVGITGKENFVDSVLKEAKRRQYSRNKKPGKRTPFAQFVKVQSIEKVGVRAVYDIIMESGGWDERIQISGNRQQRKTARSPRNNFLIQGGVVVHNCDEEPSNDHWNESRMRLHASDGLTQLSLTPVSGISWTYDELYVRAGYRWCSKAVQDFAGLPEEETLETGSPNIAVVHIATDDNPTLTKESIDRIFEGIDDPDELAVRRYGVFRQVSGRVHKAYNPQIHYIDYNKHFPGGIPYEWVHARGIDYHESRIPWSVGWMSVSKDDEWFLWQEFHPSIDGPKAYTTPEIARSIVRKSGDLYYICNLIDPLANKKQANTGFSVTEDLNRIFDEIRKDDGLGAPTYWEGWDTKDTKGRDEIRKRFKNAALVGRPFSNVSRKHGETVRLPTLWICDTCPSFHKSIQRWSFGEWATVQSKAANDPQVKPSQKWSHDPVCLECLAKDIRLVRAASWERPRFDQKYSQTGRPICT